MVAITLPDGSVRRFDSPVTGEALAADIGPGLAKAALAVKVDGELRDLARPIEKDAKVEIVKSAGLFRRAGIEEPVGDHVKILRECEDRVGPRIDRRKGAGRRRRHALEVTARGSRVHQRGNPVDRSKGRSDGRQGYGLIV